MKYTDGQLISYEIQATKPGPAAFSAVCDRFAIDPAETVFIDDSAANITATAVLGFHMVLFQGYPDAPDQLSQLPLAYNCF